MSWSMAKLWYSMENIWFIQVSHNNMFYQYNDWQVKYSNGK